MGVVSGVRVDGDDGAGVGVSVGVGVGVEVVTGIGSGRSSDDDDESARAKPTGARKTAMNVKTTPLGFVGDVLDVWFIRSPSFCVGEHIVPPRSA